MPSAFENGTHRRNDPARVEMPARRKERGREVEVSIGMVNDADGRLSHRLLAFADRSGLARLREERRLPRALAAAP
ncbi:MAG: hypothetical protein RML56_10115 [Burkholderiales bacterium]|nr:hypothetical protein [Burkholderiales bacterium]